jgi:hypothetical protein
MMQLEIDEDISVKLGRFVSLGGMGILPWSARDTKHFLYSICYLGGYGRGCRLREMQE